jgi:fumarate reductase flavoprotein subunit
MRISKGTADATMVRIAVDIAPETIEWLRGGDFDFHPDCPAIVFNHEAYAIPRTYWGTNKAISILDLLRRQIDPLIAHGTVQIQLRTRAKRILRDGALRVAGVVVVGPDGAEREIRARQVVLTAGGYGGDPESFERFTPGMQLYGPLPPQATGEGITMAIELGAGFRNAGNFLPIFGGFESEPDGHRVAWADRPLLQPQHRAPWEIYVDTRGERFVAEDSESNDHRERALLALPGMVFWVVYDQAIARDAPRLLPSFDAARLEAHFRTHPGFQRAHTIAELALQMSVPPDALATTIRVYNRAVACGGDPLGRKHLPRAITEPPFFALRNRGLCVKSAGGIDVDTLLRVRRVDGRAFENLYAAGETIGGGLLSGNAFVGGMSITPWLGFGRIIGRDFLQ